MGVIPGRAAPGRCHTGLSRELGHVDCDEIKPASYDATLWARCQWKSERILTGGRPLPVSQRAGSGRRLRPNTGFKDNMGSSGAGKKRQAGKADQVT